MELRDYLRIVRKNWIIIIGLTLAGVALAAGMALRATPVYQSTATLYVSFNTTQESGSAGELNAGVTYTSKAIASYIDVTNTAIVMDQVAAELGPEFDVAQLNQDITASAPKDTSIIEMTATDSNPKNAALKANTAGAVLADVITNKLELPPNGGPSRVELAIIDPATIPASPISPNVTRNLTLGFLLGLMLGFGAAVLRDLLDTRIRSRADLAAITQTPILGEIPDDPGARTDPLMTSAGSNSPRAEPFRTLRTNLQFLSVEGSPHTFVVTSSLPAEGKTTVSMNLAATLSETGARVALVEGDLRKPLIPSYLGIEGAVGLTDVLIGRVSLDTAIQKWGKNSLYVLPAGAIPPNPSELLGSKAMQDVIESLSRQFDYVIIDAPPILLVTDAAVVSRYTGGVVMVAAAGKTKKMAFARAIDTLGTVHANLLGLVMTMVPTKGPDAYSYGSYSYGQYAADAVRPEHPGFSDRSGQIANQPAGRTQNNVAAPAASTIPSVPNAAAAGPAVQAKPTPSRVKGTKAIFPPLGPGR